MEPNKNLDYDFILKEITFSNRELLYVFLTGVAIGVVFGLGFGIYFM